jgi:hypothetical protein
VHNNLSATRYSAQGGTSVQHDFAEAPSQMLEDWVYDKRVLKVFAEVCPGADPDRNPGFQAWFVLRNQRTPWTEPELELPGVSVEFRDIDPETVRFDLKLDITARPGPYRARLEFNRDVTTEESAASMASELGAFMRIASQEPHLGIAELGQRASVRCSSAVPNS